MTSDQQSSSSTQPKPHGPASWLTIDRTFADLTGRSFGTVRGVDRAERKQATLRSFLESVPGTKYLFFPVGFYLVVHRGYPLHQSTW